MAPLLALPNEHSGKQQDRGTNSADCVEDIGDADGIDPRHHAEDEDGAERVARESQRDEGVAYDLCECVSKSGKDWEEGC
jgi:hypothetical protein